MNEDIKSSVIRIFALLLATVLFGTIAYHVVEGRDWFDCFYMTVITITTTGYGELWEMSIYGRIISVFLMFFGVGIFFYSISVLSPVFLEMKLRRWEKMLEKMKDHCIICGYGLMGREIAKQLPKDKVVIIDIDVNRVELAREEGYVAIHGNATDDATLEKAKVREAKSIICCMNDSTNAFTVITAKSLSPQITTVVVLRNPEAEKNLRRIGVDYLLSPYRDTALKVYALMRKKASVEFVEAIISGGEMLGLEKVIVDEKLSGKTLKELDLRRRTGCIVVAIVRGKNVIVPSAETVLERGDIMFVIGTEDSLKKFMEMIS